MVTKSQVMDMHAKHPDWYAGQIAAALGCSDAYVRSTGRRYKLNLPKGTRGSKGAAKAALAHELGIACLACDITLADILDYAENRKPRGSARRSLGM